MHGKIREGLLKLILLERNGDMVDRGRLRGLVRMLVELGLYAPLEQVCGNFHEGCPPIFPFSASETGEFRPVKHICFHSLATLCIS